MHQKRAFRPIDTIQPTPLTPWPTEEATPFFFLFKDTLISNPSKSYFAPRTLLAYTQKWFAFELQKFRSSSFPNIFVTFREYFVLPSYNFHFFNTLKNRQTPFSLLFHLATIISLIMQGSVNIYSWGIFSVRPSPPLKNSSHDPVPNGNTNLKIHFFSSSWYSGLPDKYRHGCSRGK